ncbi:MAG: hypothetical protein EOM25_03795 [Deltaproteobacteria bacterium]|nr:hypothetical protein [Deltaproteobacteria bacterium]
MTSKEKIQDEDVFELTEIIEEDAPDDFPVENVLGENDLDTEFKDLLDDSKPDDTQEAFGEDLDIDALFKDLDDDRPDTKASDVTADLPESAVLDLDAEIDLSLETDAAPEEPALPEPEPEFSVDLPEPESTPDLEVDLPKPEAEDALTDEERELEKLGEEVKLGELENLISGLDEESGPEPDADMRGMLDESARVPGVSIEEFQSLRADLDAMHERLAATEQAAPSAEDGIAPLAEDLAALREKVETIEKSVAEEKTGPLAADIDSLKERVQALPIPTNDELVALIRENLPEPPAIPDVEAVSAEIRNEIQTGLDECRNERDGLKGEIQALKSQIQELSDQREALQSEVRALAAAPSAEAIEAAVTEKLRVELERLIPDAAARILREEIAALKG